MRKRTKREKSNYIDQVVDRFIRAGNLKSLPHFVFSTILLHFFRVLHIYASKDQFGQDIGPITSLGVDFGTIRG